MSKTKTGARTVFVCQSCGSQSRKWAGRCPDCGAWNALVEEPEPSASSSSSGGGPDGGRYGAPGGPAEVRRYADIDVASTPRHASGFGEFDRVLGGGIVPGSVVLVGGEPGIGKSTLLLQVAGRVAGSLGSVLYASGEESEHQVKERGQRLGMADVPLYLLAETCLERLLDAVERVQPAMLVVDSIQTIYSLKLASAPGSVGQVREAATHLLFNAKRRNLPTFLVGHVTKEGSLAGPKVLEHVVDTVLYFEGERRHAHRVVRAVKNRFGAVSELGVFEMTGTGLAPVPNPSRLFLSDRAESVPGSVVLCSAEGSRPILVELQALVTAGAYGSARRMASGIDHNRLSLLLAVLEKRAGLSVAGEDVFVNVAGGLAIAEPAADLAVVAAVASSLRDRGVPPGTAVFGEVGLGGEIRGTTQADMRIREAAQLGFTRCVLPEANIDPDDAPPGCELVGVGTVEAALDALARAP